MPVRGIRSCCTPIPHHYNPMHSPARDITREFWITPSPVIMRCRLRAQRRSLWTELRDHGLLSIFRRC
jgi:hypothetical protein